MQKLKCFQIPIPTKLELPLKIIFSWMQGYIFGICFVYFDKTNTVSFLALVSLYLLLSGIIDILINNVNSNSAYNLKCRENETLQLEIDKVKKEKKSLEADLIKEENASEVQKEKTRDIIECLNSTFREHHKENDSYKLEKIVAVIRFISDHEEYAFNTTSKNKTPRLSRAEIYSNESSPANRTTQINSPNKQFQKQKFLKLFS